VIRVPGPVNVEIQRTPKSKSLVVHIDKLKPYVCRENNSDSYHKPVENSDVESNSSSSSSPDGEPETQPVDVVTYNEDQEWRRSRPRRNAGRPARYRD
jgi:hypothetical protein